MTSSHLGLLRRGAATMPDACDSSEFFNSTDLRVRIVRSDEGGPMRTIVNGRQRKWTGKFFCLKAGARSMPWESRRCELPLLKLAETSSAVLSLMAQPHRLELRLGNYRNPLVYYPDAEFTVEPSFLHAYRDGESFCRALLEWIPGAMAESGSAKVIVEAKDDSDRRMSDPDYRRKLALAKIAYRSLGIHMVTVLRSTDLDSLDFEPLEAMLPFRLAKITAMDEITVTSMLQEAGDLSLLDVAKALGGWHLGRAKAYALHFRRLISIDMTARLSADSRVRLMPSAVGGERRVS